MRNGFGDDDFLQGFATPKRAIAYMRNGIRDGKRGFLAITTNKFCPVFAI